MALPTAPLGQLPSMNMPYAIPTYDRGPSIWEKALGAFLVNAAGNVAGTLADNVLTRDEASTFGEENATGFGRLLGPNVTKEEALQRRSQAFQAGEAEKSRAFDADQRELELMSRGGENDANAANARLLQSEDIQARLDQQLLEDQNALVRDDRRTAADLERDRVSREFAGGQTDKTIAAQRELEELRALLDSRDPNKMAQAERDRAAAEEARGRIDFNRQFFGSQGMGGGTPPPQASAQPAVDPSIAAFARARSTTPTFDAETNDAAMREFMSYMPNADGTPVAPAAEVVNPSDTMRILMQLFEQRGPNRIQPGIGNTR